MQVRTETESGTGGSSSASRERSSTIFDSIETGVLILGRAKNDSPGLVVFVIGRSEGRWWYG